MPLYVATAFFSQNGHGWSESYYRDSGGITDLAAIADFDRNNLWTKRAKCCGLQTTIEEQRVSLVSVKGDSVLNYIPLAGNAGFDSEDADTALLIRFGNADNTKRKNTFLRGVADDVVIEGGRVGRGFAVFTNALNDFTTALIQNQYGWYGTDAKVDMPVTDYTSDTENRIVFTLGAGSLPVLAVGDKLVVRGKNLGIGGKSVLNTSLPCTYLGNNQIRTVKPIAAFPFPGPGGFLTRRTYALQVIQNSRLQKVVGRKAGKVSYISRGRVAARARG